MKREDWEEVTLCPHCGYKLVRPWRKHPNGLYGNKITCPGGLCKKEFVVNYAILRDKGNDGGILEKITHEGHQPRQSLLEDFN